MKKIIVISTLILILTLLFIWLFKYSTNNKSNFFVSSFVKNNSFETNFEKDVPYKKWDEIEFSFILENNNTSKKEVTLKLEEIKKQIDITEIYIDWKKVSTIDKINIDTNQAKQINIKWITKNNKINNNEVNIVKETKDIIEEPKKEDIKNKIDYNITSKEISLNKNDFSSNIDNLLIITFEKPEIVDFVMIWEKSIKPNYTQKNKIYLNIPKLDFETWEYFLALLLKNWNIIGTNHALKFTLDKNIVNIINITPKEIKNDLDRNIVLQWNWFKKVIWVQLSNSVILKKTSFEIVNDMVMIVKIPLWLEVWEYHLNLMDINSIYELKDKTFSIIK